VAAINQPCVRFGFSRHGRRRSARNGSVLLLVLVVIAILTLGAATYSELMRTEHRAVRYHGRAAQALRLAESGVEYVRSQFALPPAELVAAGGVVENPTLFQGVLVDDQPDDFSRGRVTIIAPRIADGYYSGFRYGLENESSKLNLNVLLATGAEQQARSRLTALPGMTAETADAILDWLDADDEPRDEGAEYDYYQGLDPPYEPRNGPIASLDELLQVRGVTPELLYGYDQNRNMQIDGHEQARGLLVELDNTYGVLNRGWSAYLTIHSIEAMRGAGGSPLVDLNGAKLQPLHTELVKIVGIDKANFIIAYRQFGPQPVDGGQNAGGGNNQSSSGGSSSDSGGGQQSRQQRGGNQANSGNQPPQGGAPAQNLQTVTPGSLQLDFQKEAGAPIPSPLHLIGAKVQFTPSGDNAQPQLVESPWPDSQAGYRDLLTLYDAVSVGSSERIAGRVNLTTAPRAVLRSIPDMPAGAPDRIVATREPDPDPLGSEQRHPIWPLVQGIVKLDEMKKLERYVTSGGDVWSGQAVGFFDAGPIAARGEFVIDCSGQTPRLRAWRDLSPLGRGFGPLQLGVQPAERN
jgi:hypothetical protein